LTLKGGYECGLWTAQGLRQGIQLLRKAIDSDPTYAPAYARLASCYSDLSFFGFASPTEANPLARAAIDRALALDSTLGVAFATRGWIRFVTDFDFNGPDADFRRALVLSPRDASIVAAYASYLTLAGRFDDAILQGRNAIALDPLSAPTSINLAWTYFKAHRFDDAIAQLKRTIELEPGYRFAHMELAWNYSEKAMHAEAAAQCDTASHDAAPEISVVFYTCGWVYGRAGRVAEARQMLELLSAFSERYWENPYDFAVLYLGLGERERALGYLRRAVAVRTQSLVFLRVEPQLDPLRSDPAFQALLRQVGVAP
jgi:tetratricopeptide (TPR) repeat protein